MGYLGDLLLDPINYLGLSIPTNIGIKAYDDANYISLNLGTFVQSPVIAHSISPVCHIHNLQPGCALLWNPQI